LLSAFSGYRKKLFFEGTAISAFMVRAVYQGFGNLSRLFSEFPGKIFIFPGREKDSGKSRRLLAGMRRRTLQAVFGGQIPAPAGEGYQWVKQIPFSRAFSRLGRRRLIVRVKFSRLRRNMSRVRPACFLFFAAV
jgi:hypothetical protein